MNNDTAQRRGGVTQFFLVSLLLVGGLFALPTQAQTDDAPTEEVEDTVSPEIGTGSISNIGF